MKDSVELKKLDIIMNFSLLSISTEENLTFWTSQCTGLEGSLVQGITKDKGYYEAMIEYHGVTFHLPFQAFQTLI